MQNQDMFETRHESAKSMARNQQLKVENTKKLKSKNRKIVQEFMSFCGAVSRAEIGVTWTTHLPFEKTMKHDISNFLAVEQLQVELSIDAFSLYMYDVDFNISVVSEFYLQDGGNNQLA